MRCWRTWRTAEALSRGILIPCRRTLMMVEPAPVCYLSARTPLIAACACGSWTATGLQKYHPGMTTTPGFVTREKTHVLQIFARSGVRQIQSTFAAFLASFLSVAPLLKDPHWTPNSRSRKNGGITSESGPHEESHRSSGFQKRLDCSGERRASPTPLVLL